MFLSHETEVVPDHRLAAVGYGIKSNRPPVHGITKLWRIATVDQRCVVQFQVARQSDQCSIRRRTAAEQLDRLQAPVALSDKGLHRAPEFRRNFLGLQHQLDSPLRGLVSPLFFGDPWLLHDRLAAAAKK